jgi:predicted DNA-binding transcriptional regulator AlpA
MKLSLLSILLGLGMSVPQIYGLTKPKQFAAAARKFPRSLPIGVVLMLLATAWFVWNVNIEPIADFSVFKKYMIAGFTAVGILACFFVQDFLAVRGLAVVMLLLAKLMVDTGGPHLGESSFVLVIQIWAYLLVVAGIWFTVTPWKLRDILNWATATEERIRVGSAIRLAFAVFVLILGLTAFRAM